MIYFFADNHYGVHPGKVIYEHLPVELKEKITFFNDEWEPLEHSDWNRDCELLILNMIGATCDQPHPGADAEKRVRSYLDGMEASTHPKKPYLVTRSKTRHPLAARLREMNLPTDEIYTNLENTCPCVRLMETHIEEGTFVQCCEAISPWGGRLVSFIPGHEPAVTSNPGLIANPRLIMSIPQTNSGKLSL